MSKKSGKPKIPSKVIREFTLDEFRKEAAEFRKQKAESVKEEELWTIPEDWEILNFEVGEPTLLTWTMINYFSKHSEGTDELEQALLFLSIILNTNIKTNPVKNKKQLIQNIEETRDTLLSLPMDPKTIKEIIEFTTQYNQTYFNKDFQTFASRVEKKSSEGGESSSEPFHSE